MPEADATATKSLDDTIFDLGVALTKLLPGALAQLRRAKPGEGVASFWRLYHSPKLSLEAQPGRDVDWEWVVTALALLTPTGTAPNKQSVHEAGISLGQALFEAEVKGERVAKVLNAPFAQRRDALMRLVRVLARANARFDTRELAKLLLFGDGTPNERDTSLRRLASRYYAAEAAAQKGKSDD